MLRLLNPFAVPVAVSSVLHALLHALLYAVLCAGLCASLAPRLLFAAQMDTLRVGSVPLREITAGVDTIEVYNVENGVRTPVLRSVVRRTIEQYQGRTVLRIVTEDPRTRTEALVAPGTLQLLRFRRKSAMDSTAFELRDRCFTGWTDMPNQPRRAIECVAASDRFGSGALDAVVMSALPLRGGLVARVATFDAYGDITSFPVRVVGVDTVRTANRKRPAWRVERSQSVSGTVAGSTAVSELEVKTTWWVDVSTARVLQEQLAVTRQGVTRESWRVLVATSSSAVHFP